MRNGSLVVGSGRNLTSPKTEVKAAPTPKEFRQKASFFALLGINRRQETSLMSP